MPYVVKNKPMKENYQGYDEFSLAQEEEFVGWVKHGHKDAAWQHWLVQHPEQQDKVRSARQLVTAIMESVPEIGSKRKADLWDKIEEATPAHAKVRLIQNRRQWWSIAAAIVLLLGLAWWLTPNGQGSWQTIQTAQAEVTIYQLPDASTVSLNAASSISYNENSWASERKIDLEGEAFFEVQKGQTFTVNTNLGSVQVLGTSFNVESRNERLRVICYTGRVRVTNLGGEAVELSPGQSVSISATQMQTATVSNENDIAWQEQVHHFQERSLDEVFAELERQYAVQVQYSDTLAKRLYTGFFSSKNLEEALQNICWPTKLSYTINGQQVTITSQE